MLWLWGPRIQGIVFGLRILGLGFGIRILGSGFRILGAGLVFGVQHRAGCWAECSGRQGSLSSLQCIFMAVTHT